MTTRFLSGEPGCDIVMARRQPRRMTWYGWSVVTASDVLKLKMVSAGGAAVILEPLE